MHSPGDATAPGPSAAYFFCKKETRLPCQQPCGASTCTPCHATSSLISPLAADAGEDALDPQTWSEERKSAGKRIFVLTPEGEALQVYHTDNSTKCVSLAAS